jgi:lysozyme
MAFFRTPAGNIHPAVKGAAGATAAWLVIAVALVAPSEGLYTKAYYDIVGVKTVCYGATAADGVDLTRTYTPAECRAILSKDLVKYDKMVHSCIHVAIPPNREGALVDFTYNLGQGALCHGAVARDLNAGNVAAGCYAMLAYDHGRVHGRMQKIKGLTARRHLEYPLCLKDY